MDPVDAYQGAAAAARHATIRKFGPAKWPVKPGTPEHEYWLEQMDKGVDARIAA